MIFYHQFTTPEERRKVEEKRIQEEERLRQQLQDNWAERALVLMMGGKLEDRSEQEDKVELVKPDWMVTKTKDEMTEEEKKMVKDFEKRQAVIKDEQEKYRKALETELRKLQSSIGEICESFDHSVQEFFNGRISNDQIIYQTELKILKLNQCAVFSENDEQREKDILSRLDLLKNEKVVYLTEIPEIKVCDLITNLIRRIRKTWSDVEKNTSKS
jgi:hypothetical protein